LIGYGYLDSSVAVHLMDNTRYRKALVDWFESAPLTWVSSRLLRTECIRVLQRDKKPLSDFEVIQKRVNLVDVTESIHETAESFDENIRTLDALHLATLLSLNPEKSGQLIVLVSHDKQMLETALAYGVVTSDPVADLQRTRG